MADLQTQVQQLEKGGFSQVEINNWKQEKVEQLTQGGFTGEETDLDDLKYYADILKKQNENPKQFKKTFAPFHSFIDETKNLISTEVIKILDPTSYNNDLKRFRDDMYSLYIKGIGEGRSPLELLDYKNRNFIGKDFIQYQSDKNKIFKNMMDNIEKEEVDESIKRLPGETPSEYLKRISE